MQTLETISAHFWKSSFASAPPLKLTLRANGEEKTSLIDENGNLVVAGIDPPTVGPSLLTTLNGLFSPSEKPCYVYVYVAGRNYRFVDNVITGGGDDSPRSNPSPITQAENTAAFNVNITVRGTTRADISKIWIYRTDVEDTSTPQHILAEAGNLFFIAAIDNPGTATDIIFIDNRLEIQEPIELDNFVAPTARFCVYNEPYFYLFGNAPLKVLVNVDATGNITILDTQVWLSGRNGQFAKLTGIDTGGYDELGTFFFQYSSNTTGRLSLDPSGNTPVYPAKIGKSLLTIYYPATTLWRSKARNPFSWGETVTIADSNTPQLWEFQVGGGYGSGLAIVPNNALLKLDTQEPPRSYVMNLRVAENEAFRTSLRSISDQFSCSHNSSQFIGNLQGRSILIFIDQTQFAILQTDGNSVSVISDAVNKTLKSLATGIDLTCCHGVYDPLTKLNCIWIRTTNTTTPCELLIWLHSTSSEWGMSYDFDITSSTSLQDKLTEQNLILGGSEVGLLGRILSPNTNQNWITAKSISTSNSVFTKTQNSYSFDTSGSPADQSYFTFNTRVANALRRIFLYFDNLYTTGAQESTDFGFLPRSPGQTASIHVFGPAGDVIGVTWGIAGTVTAAQAAQSFVTYMGLHATFGTISNFTAGGTFATFTNNAVGVAVNAITSGIAFASISQGVDAVPLASAPPEAYGYDEIIPAINTLSIGNLSAVTAALMTSRYYLTQFDFSLLPGLTGVKIFELTHFDTLPAASVGTSGFTLLQIGGNITISTSAISILPLVGSWILVETSLDGLSYFYARLSVVATNLLTINKVLLLHGTIPSSGLTNIFFGATHCYLHKTIDLEDLPKNKELKEVWLNSLSAQKIETNGIDQEIIRLGFHSDFAAIPEKNITPEAISGSTALVVRANSIPSNFRKVFGFSIDQRGTRDFELKSITLMVNSIILFFALMLNGCCHSEENESIKQYYDRHPEEQPDVKGNY